MHVLPAVSTRTVRRAVATVALALCCASCGRGPSFFQPGPDPAVASAASASASVAAHVAKPLPPGQSPGPDAHVPHPAGVAETDPTAVAIAWAEVAYGYDTRYDSSPNDAWLRATGYLTDDLSAKQHAYQPRTVPGPQWNGWAAHQAWTTATPVQGTEERITDSADTVERQLVVRATAEGRDGWKGPGPQVAAFLTLRRTPAGVWRISQINTGPA